MNGTLWKGRVQSTPSAPRSMPDLIWQVLFSRGIHTAEAIENWFSPKLTELKNPFILNNMDKACERIMQAYSTQEKMCIYADFDMDGTSGLALLKKGFELLGFKNIECYQPKRLSQGYGVHSEAIDELAQSNVKLIVTVDVGITANVAAARARELGIEMIITDHHQPKDELPQVYAIVNPNTKECTSKMGHLCGTGVAFYLVLALRRKFLDAGLLKQDFNPKDLLDCFTIGTLSDMVPLIEENRLLVKHGLVELAKTKRPGLRLLLKELNLNDRPLTSQDVAIRFAPKLNALSRMELGVTPLQLFLVEDEEKAAQLVSEVIVSNNLRVSLQEKAEKEALDSLKNQNPQGFVWVWSKNFHRGVIGLVATRLSQMYSCPAFVGACDADGTIIGSARLPDHLRGNVLDLLEQASSCLVKFGGHQMAAGFELGRERADDFHQALENACKNVALAQTESVIYYDAAGTVKDMDPQFMSWFENLGPFGTDFPVPVFLFSEVSVINIRDLRGGHVKLNVYTGDGMADAIWFSPPKTHEFFQHDSVSGLKVDLLAEPQWNYFNGRKTVQLLIKKLRMSISK